MDSYALGQRLRGGLPAEPPGARGIEKAARNVRCLRRTAILLASLSPETVSREAYGEESGGVVSPFAVLAGNRFEARLLDLEAARVISLYRQAGRITPMECKVVNLASLRSKECVDISRVRRELTENLLLLKLAGAPEAPNLILKARLAVRLLGQEFLIEPDGLFASDHTPFYLPIEMKAFADRGGKTSASDLRGSLRQATVSVLALRQFLDRIGKAKGGRIVPPVVDLVLRRGHGRRASLHSMEVEGELRSVTRLIEREPIVMQAVACKISGFPAVQGIGVRSVLESLPTALSERCFEHCPLSSRCMKEVRQRGGLAMFGAKAETRLSAAGTVDRAIELMHDTGNMPGNIGEKNLHERLAKVSTLIDEVRTYGY